MWMIDELMKMETW